MASLPPKLSHSRNQFHQLSRPEIESLDLRAITSTRFNLKFLRVFSKKDTPENFIYFFLTKKLVRLFTRKDVKPSPESKMIKLPIFDNLFLPLRHSRQNS